MRKFWQGGGNSGSPSSSLSVGQAPELDLVQQEWLWPLIPDSNHGEQHDHISFKAAPLGLVCAENSLYFTNLFQTGGSLW